MKMTFTDLATLIGDMANISVPRVARAEGLVPSVPYYMFTEAEVENLVHNLMVGEFAKDGDYVKVPTWALATKARHRKEERTPAQHLGAILQALDICGFDIIEPQVSEYKAAKFAAAAHEDVTEVIPRVLGPLYTPYAPKHDEHDRRFCDAVARGIIAACVKKVEMGFRLSPPENTQKFLDWTMEVVALYHDAWGF